MKLRHMFATAAVAALAVTPLAASGSAGAAAFDAHSYRFDDNTPDQHIVGTIDITKVHLYRNTAGDFRAVVSYKDLQQRPATKWAVAFEDNFIFNPCPGFPFCGEFKAKAKSKGQISESETRGVAMEYRIGPDGKAAAFGYQYDPNSSTDPKPTVCKGFGAKPDYAANTITYSIPRSCWNLTDSPTNVSVMSRLFSKSEWRSNFQSYYTEEPNRTDNAYGYWGWRNGTQSDVKRQGTPLDRTPFYRH